MRRVCWCAGRVATKQPRFFETLFYRVVMPFTQALQFAEPKLSPVVPMRFDVIDNSCSGSNFHAGAHSAKRFGCKLLSAPPIFAAPFRRAIPSAARRFARWRGRRFFRVHRQCVVDCRKTRLANPQAPLCALLRSNCRQPARRPRFQRLRGSLYETVYRFDVHAYLVRHLAVVA